MKHVEYEKINPYFYGGSPKLDRLLLSLKCTKYEKRIA